MRYKNNLPHGVKNEVHLQQVKQLNTTCRNCGFETPKSETYLYNKKLICSGCYNKVTKGNRTPIDQR